MQGLHSNDVATSYVAVRSGNIIWSRAYNCFFYEGSCLESCLNHSICKAWILEASGAILNGEWSEILRPTLCMNQRLACLYVNYPHERSVTLMNCIWLAAKTQGARSKDLSAYTPRFASRCPHSPAAATTAATSPRPPCRRPLARRVADRQAPSARAEPPRADTTRRAQLPTAPSIRAPSRPCREPTPPGTMQGHD